jgi:hypothetical protein
VTNKEKGEKWQPLQPKKSNKTSKNNVVCKEGEGGHVRQNKLESQSDSFPNPLFSLYFLKRICFRLKHGRRFKRDKPFFKCFLLIEMHPETGQSLGSLHSRVMWSPP